MLPALPGLLFIPRHDECYIEISSTFVVITVLHSQFQNTNPMAKTIQQKVVFKNTTPEVLYRLYMNEKLHAQLTGGAVEISGKMGAAFSAYDGYCWGRNLQLVENKLIVQSWRASDWNDEDVDSTFILLFESKGGDAVLTMVHANVPDKQAKALSDGWNEFYWKPWKNYLSGNTSEKLKSK